jgi:ABC-type glycerol-3-phosphate transport system permease component
VCAMGGYALAKFTFAGRAAIFTLILVALTIPFEVRIIPQYILIARDLGLTNTWWAIILPGLANALGMFFMRQNMLAVPSELLEAARIDGASEWRIFYAVVLPIMQPALAAVGILLFLFQWNDFLWPLLVLTQPRRLHDPGGARDAGGAHARIVGRHHGGDGDRHRPLPDHVPLPPALLRRRHHRRRGEGLTS